MIGGAGEGFLASLIINWDLQDYTVGLKYFYCVSN